MQDYYRIERWKFWAWVGVSLAIGLVVGLAVFAWRATADARRVANLEQRVETASAEASAAVAELQSRLATAEASVAELQAANTKLTADLASATAAAQAAQKADSDDAKVEITSRSVSPESVDASGNITLTVKVKGHPEQVRMQIVGTGGIKFDKLYYLTKSSTDGDVETWKKTIAAPDAKGTYRYYAGAIKDGKKTTMPGVSSWTFQVK